MEELSTDAVLKCVLTQRCAVAYIKGLPSLKDALVNEYASLDSIYGAWGPFTEWPSVDSTAFVSVALLSDGI